MPANAINGIDKIVPADAINGIDKTHRSSTGEDIVTVAWSDRVSRAAMDVPVHRPNQWRWRASCGKAGEQPMVRATGLLVRQLGQRTCKGGSFDLTTR